MHFAECDLAWKCIFLTRSQRRTPHGWRAVGVTDRVPDPLIGQRPFSVTVLKVSCCGTLIGVDVWVISLVEYLWLDDSKINVVGAAFSYLLSYMVFLLLYHISSSFTERLSSLGILLPTTNCLAYPYILLACYKLR